MPLNSAIQNKPRIYWAGGGSVATRKPGQSSAISDLITSFRSAPEPYFPRNLMDNLTMRDVAFLMRQFKVGRNDCYTFWRDVFFDISRRFSRDHEGRKHGKGEGWRYVASADASGDWEHAAECARDLDQNYADIVERKLLVHRTRQLLPVGVPFERVFLMLLHAKTSELDKLQDMRQRERDRKRREKLRSDCESLVESFGPLLECLDEDEKHRDAWTNASVPGSNSKAPSVTAKSLLGEFLRTSFVLPDLKSLCRDDGLSEFIRTQDPSLFSKLVNKRNTTGADFIRIAKISARFSSGNYVETLSSPMGDRHLAHLPSIQAPGKRSGRLEAATDASHLTFEAIVKLARKGDKTQGAGILAERLCALWGILVTISKHKGWKRSKRGADALM